ncbi:MAG TPA: hypothetical protein VGW34_10600 [Allosphingosinicella sp.]|nr:hypothetical protein [Allosphingosinicella sp.]
MSGDPLEGVFRSAAAPRDAPDLRTAPAPDGSEAYDVAERGDDCPVTPLGFFKKTNYFLDWAGQLIDLGSEFRKGELMQLFGTSMAWLDARFPQMRNVGSKDKPIFEQNGFSQTDAQRSLIMACAKAGLFDPTGKVRGRGSHRGKDGELILHCGDAVLTGGRRGTRGNLLKPAWSKPGPVAGFVYPTESALAHPAEAPAPAHVAAEIIAKLDSWNWKRKRPAPGGGPGGAAVGGPGGASIDAYLLFCWVATALMGGFVKHRPHAWITGPTGTGKTTLQEFLRALMGDWGVFTEDATEAGVRQLLDQDTLAVMFDELEPDEGNAEVHMKIVKLARLAYSGGGGLRGGQDHKSKQFTIRSCFLFSSIHHHELPAQDRNRIAVLHLDRFAARTPQFVLPATAKAWGDALRRRLVEQCHRYEATLAAYTREMLEHGYSGREQNTYGTLLACGDLLLFDEAPPERIQAALNGDEDRCAGLVARLAHVLDSARAESEDTTERALKYLGSKRLPAAGGRDQETIGRWLAKAVIEIVNNGGQGAARAKLLTHGLALVHLAPDHEEGSGQGGLSEAKYPDQAIYLAVANQTNQGMKEIFEGSTFRGGVWSQALKGVDGAIVNKKKRFGQRPEGCVLVPLGEVIDVDAARHEAHLLRLDAQAEQRG